MGWQKTITLAKRKKGCHLVTEEIVSHIQPGLQGVEVGMLFLFIKHTSAALTVNENWDIDVRRDMDMALDKIVPEDLDWKHTDEGPDDSPRNPIRVNRSRKLEKRVAHEGVTRGIIYLNSHHRWKAKLGNLARYLSHGIPTCASRTDCRGNNTYLNRIVIVKSNCDCSAV